MTYVAQFLNNKTASCISMQEAKHNRKKIRECYHMAKLWSIIETGLNLTIQFTEMLIAKS